MISKERKCPMCRKSYREGLSGDLYQIVEWEEDEAGEIRKVFFKMLEKYNPREAARIAECLGGVAEGKVELR